jgi:hypothetical protein
VAVYIAVFAIFILILWGAYRSLGVPAGSIAAPEVIAGAARRDLRAAVAAMTAAAGDVAKVGKDARRTAAAATQNLAHVRDESEGLDAVVDLLGAAAEDCAWAGRLMEQEAYAGNPGLHDAVAALLDHARRCLDEARIAEPETAPVAG